MIAADSEFTPLRKVLLCRPEYLSIEEPINVIAEKHSSQGVDRNKALEEHQQFLKLFLKYDIEVLLEKTHPRYPYQINTRDLGVSTPKGLIWGRYLKPLHWGEYRLAEQTFFENNIPAFARVDRGTFEGGDFVYLDSCTAAVGMGIRTDLKGIANLEHLLHDLNLKLIPVDFAEKYLHLDKIFNVIAEKLAVLCPEALPEDFLQLLQEKNFEMIEISPEEVFDNAANLINIGGDVIFSHHQAPKVNKKLKSLGFELEILEIEELFKSGGGLRCLSFPMDRELSGS